MLRRALLGALALLVACTAGTAGTTTITSTTATTSVPSTTSTTLPTTTTAVTSTTVFPEPDFDCPPVLVSGQDTIRLAADCSEAPLDVRPASDPITKGPLLMDDLAEGLLFQTDGDAIWWQEAGEAEARVIVQAGAGESLTLQDVAVLEGGVEVWFTRDRGSTIDDYVVILERMAITGGSASVVGEIGSWESSSTATIGGEVIALETDSEGYHGFGVRNLDLGQIPQPWNPYETLEMEDTFTCDGCPIGLIVSDDGSKVAYLNPVAQAATFLPVLVVVDLASGQEVSRLEVSGFGWPRGHPAEGPEITTIDILGDLVLVNGDDEGQPFPAVWADIGVDEPVWEQLPVTGSARFLRSDVP